MKRSLLLLSLLFFVCSSAISQVGIGNTAPGATLDIYGANYDYTLDAIGPVAKNDGVLVPRVNDLLTGGLNEGQLVYLVDTAAPSTNGFYYWDGAAWTTFKSSNASGTPVANILAPDAGILGNPDWVLIGEVSMTALTSHALIVQSSYSGNTSDDDGIITALTRRTTSAGAPGTTTTAVFPIGTIQNYAASAAPDNSWVNTVNQIRNTSGLNNNTEYFYQLWRKGNIETPVASNETYSILPMRLKQ